MLYKKMLWIFRKILFVLICVLMCIAGFCVIVYIFFIGMAVLSQKPPRIEIDYTEVKENRIVTYDKYFRQFDSIITYPIDRKLFRELVSKPTESLLDKHEELWYHANFYKKSDTDGVLTTSALYVATRFKIGTVGSVEFENYLTDGEPGKMESGFDRIGITSTLIYTSLVEFAGSKKNLEEYLLSNGIDAEIEESHVIAVEYRGIQPPFFTGGAEIIPAFVWIKTNNGVYFVTIDEERKYQDPYSYKFYTTKEFKKKFYNVF